MCWLINLKYVFTILVFDAFFAEAASTRYLVTASEGNVLSIPIDEKSNSKLITQNVTYLRCQNLNPSSISVGRKHLFAANINSNNIEKYYFEPERESGNDICTPLILNSGVPGPNVKIAFDWISNNLYWTDPTFRWIAMLSVQHEGNYTILIRDNIHIPAAIAVDPDNKYMFWSDEGEFPKIERSSMIGQDRHIIVSEDIVYPRSITVDIDNRKIYWMDFYLGRVFQSDYEGKSRKKIQINPLASMMFGQIQQFSGILLVAITKQKESLTVLTLDTSTHSTLSDIEVKTAGTSIALLDTQRDLHLHAINHTCEYIVVSEKKRKICLCGEGFVLNADDRTCASQAQFSADTTVPHPAIFWSTNKSICAVDIRAMYDTTGNYRNRKICFDVWNIQWFAIDSSEMKLIYTDGANINTLTMDGQNIRRSLVEESEEINGMALDWIDKNVYWCQGTQNGKISFVSQSTLSRYTVITGLVHPRLLTLLMSRSSMVWIEGSHDKFRIKMARITGSNVREIRSIYYEPDALSYDELTNRVYYAWGGDMYSINVDNSQISFPADPIPDVTTFSLYENHVIAANSSALGWYTINYEINATGHLNIGQATSIATYDNRGHSRIIDACKVNNGECDDICIPMGQNRVCRCGYGLSMDANKQTCSSEPLLDNFIVVSGEDQNKRIFQISLVNRNATAFVLNTTVRCMVYDAVKKRIIWRDYEKHLWYKPISPESSKVHISENIYSFDMDYSTGNIYAYYVDDYGLGIGLISPDGLKRKLKTFTLRVSDIALDPSSGLIFWTEPSKKLKSRIRRMNMDGTTEITVVSFDELGFRLTIDKRNKTIYALTLPGNIYRSEYEPNTSVLYYRAGHRVEDLIVVGDYLYYLRSDQFYLTKLHKNNKLDISHIAENPDRIKYGVIGEVISSDSPTTKCSSNNGRGECSTFCHPTPTGYTCGCQDGDQLMTDNKICKLVSGPRPTDDTNAESGEYTITAATFASKAYPAFTTEVTDTGSSSNSLYIGVSMGAVIVIIVAAIIVVKICKRSRANVKLHFGARYVRRKPIDDHSNVVNTSTQNIVDANINPNMLDPIPDLNRDMDIPYVPVNPYLELEDGDTYDCISEGGLQLIRALPPPPDDTGEPLNGSVDGGDVEEENGGYCIGRVRHCQEECNDGKE